MLTSSETASATCTTLETEAAVSTLSVAYEKEAGNCQDNHDSSDSNSHDRGCRERGLVILRGLRYRIDGVDLGGGKDGIA